MCCLWTQRVGLGVWLLVGCVVGCGAVKKGTLSESALLSAEKSTLQDPSSAQYWANLGMAYLENSQAEEAHIAFLEAIRLDGDNGLAVEGLAQLVDLTWVSQVERNALSNPTSDEVWGDVGDHYTELGLPERAHVFYMKAFSIDSSDTEWSRKIIENGGGEDLLVAFEKEAVRQQDNDEWLGDYGDLLLQMGQLLDACDQFRNAVALDPTDSEWRSKLATCEEASSNPPIAQGSRPDVGGLKAPSNPEETILALENLLQEEPDNDEYLGRLGILCVAQGEREKGLDYLLRAMHVDPTDAQWPRYVGLLTGKTRIEILNELIERHPENDELHGALGDLLVDLGRLQEAKRAYEKARALDRADKEWLEKLRFFAE